MTDIERAQIERQAQEFLNVLQVILKATRAWATVTVRVEDGQMKWPLRFEQTLK